MERENNIEHELVYAHGLAAVLMLFVAAGFGILAATELVLPDLAHGYPLLSWGRLRYDHTQGILSAGWVTRSSRSSITAFR